MQCPYFPFPLLSLFSCAVPQVEPLEVHFLHGRPFVRLQSVREVAVVIRPAAVAAAAAVGLWSGPSHWSRRWDGAVASLAAPSTVVVEESAIAEHHGARLGEKRFVYTHLPCVLLRIRLLIVSLCGALCG